MVNVGDRIRLSSMKGPDRDGVVTAVTGSLLRVRWTSGDETPVAPAPGTLAVLAGAEARPGAAARKRAAATTAGAKKLTASTGATPKKPATRKSKGDGRPQS